jgi:hypothetical protein
MITKKNPIFVQWVISLNLVLAGLRLGLKNRQVGEKWASDDCFYLCKGLISRFANYLPLLRNSKDKIIKGNLL